MGSGEKKIVAVLAVVLIGLIGAYLKFQPKSGVVQGGERMAAPGGGAESAGAGGADGASCSTGPSGGPYAKTQEMGKPGAKLEIIAVLPVAHGCHATTEAELKKAYKAHPNDIHLTVVDAQGPEAAKYQTKVKVPWTVVSINGKSSFDLGGKKVTLEKQEGMTYEPSDLGPVIEQVLARG